MGRKRRRGRVITTTHYLMLSLVLFTLGVGWSCAGNFITVLMCGS
jgi:NADH:ubiquinone oxidoreductase subunit K